MQNKRRIIESTIVFSENPKKLRKFLKQYNYDWNVKLQRDYVKNNHIMTLKTPACDQWVYNFLRANYSLNLNGNWTERLKRPEYVRVKKYERKPFPKLSSLLVTVTILSYVENYY